MPSPTMFCPESASPGPATEARDDRASPPHTVGRGAMPPGSSISRSSFSDAPQGETEMNLAQMPVIDRQVLDPPFYGVRQMTWPLQNEGHPVNSKRIRRLMRLMRRRRENSPPDCFLTLLRADRPEAQRQRTREGAHDLPLPAGGLRVDRPNRVWCADITDLPPLGRFGFAKSPAGQWMRRGFLYLVAVMDWFTRKVFDGLTRPHWGHGPISPWRISPPLEADFCSEALNEAVHRFGPPEIMNSDQGSQFTSFAWTDRLKRIGTRISMDGKVHSSGLRGPTGATLPLHLDTIFIERLWRSLTYACVYLHAWETARRRRRALADGSPATTTSGPMADSRGLLQPDRNRPAGAESGLNHPGNCPRDGE